MNLCFFFLIFLHTPDLQFYSNIKRTRCTPPEQKQFQLETSGIAEGWQGATFCAWDQRGVRHPVVLCFGIPQGKNWAERRLQELGIPDLQVSTCTSAQSGRWLGMLLLAHGRCPRPQQVLSTGKTGSLVNEYEHC